MDLARFIHVLGTIVWFGGMFFAYVALRPAATAVLQPPERLRLWQAAFRRFFSWVWISAAGILASGLWMVWELGGFAAVAPHVHVMFAMGIVMMLIFAHVFFAPFRRMTHLVEAQDWPAAATALGRIRRLVGINLALGLIVVAVGTAGRLLA